MCFGKFVYRYAWGWDEWLSYRIKLFIWWLQWSETFEGWKLHKEQKHKQEIALEMWEDSQTETFCFLFIQTCSYCGSYHFLHRKQPNSPKRNSRICFFSWFPLWWKEWKHRNTCYTKQTNSFIPLTFQETKDLEDKIQGLGLMAL